MNAAVCAANARARHQNIPHAGPSACRLLWMNITRVIVIAVVLTRHGSGHLLSLLARSWPRVNILRKHAIMGPDRLRLLFEDLGGTFIKFGQMLALQPDILSLEYCNGLLDLLDRISPFPYCELERVFKEETGCKPSEAFDSFDPEPVATASVGQVHVAWLGGRKFAVKVQRPSVQSDFAGDIRLMTGSLWVIRRLHLRPFYWLIEPIGEFLAWTREELDFRREASYMRQAWRNAQSNPHERVPELLEKFVTRRTLVMEFLPGSTLLSYLRAREDGPSSLISSLEERGFDSHTMAAHIIDNFLGDVFQYGLFHADLHPANLMILPENIVGYIDFGITGCISSYSRQNLIALTLAYTSGDLKGMCDAFFRVSAMDSSTSAARFQQGLARDSRNWYEKDGRSVRLRKNFTLVMLDMLRLSRESGVWPERDVIKYIRSAIAIDGLITRFAPRFDLGQHLRDTCDRYLKWHMRRSMFTMNNLIGWTAANVHLFRDGGLRGLETLRRLAVAQYLPEHRSHDRATDLARSRVTYLAGFLASACFTAWLAPEPVQLGANVFTAALASACAAFCWLISSVRNLQSGERPNA